MTDRLRRLPYALLLSLAMVAPGCARASPSGQAAEVHRVPASVRSVEALASLLPSMTPGRVERIVDGDTIVVSFEAGTGLGPREKVRLIGVDTPETVDPRRPVQRFGEEASRFASGRLLGKTVMLSFGPELRDYFGRLLAYVFFDDGTCFNLAVVHEGYGFAYTKYPFALMDDFREAEREARTAGRGLWG